MITINVNFKGLSHDQQVCIGNACKKWQGTLKNPISIEIDAVGVPGLGMFGGLCVPNLKQTSSATLTTAQMKAMGLLQNTSSTHRDMVIFFNTGPTVTYNYSNHGTTDPHFETMVLHEICHGLGFIDLCNVNHSGGICSDISLIGELSAINSGLLSDIPFHKDLLKLTPGIPTPFVDLFIDSGNTKKPISSLSAKELAVAFTSSALTIKGNGVAGSLVRYPIYSPKTFQAFSSCGHIDNSNGCLMHYMLQNQVINSPDQATKDVLAMIGWSIQ